MARLILEESGTTRRFKLSQGKLTFGSGEKATLTLASDDVAALHGQIEMGEDGAVLRIAKGVQAPKVGGQPIKGSHVMREGQTITIGDAKLSIEYDEGEAPQGAAASSPAPVSRAGSSRGGSSRRPSGGSSRGTTRASRGDDEDEGGRRQRPTRKSSGMPGWALGLIVLVIIVTPAYLLLGRTADSMGEGAFNYELQMRKFEREKGDDPGAARVTLKKIGTHKLTAQQKKVVEKELGLLDDQLSSLDDDARNSEISTYLKMRIFDYEQKRPVTTDRSHARVFVKRARAFIEGYPTHPELARVERLLTRVAPVAVESEPAIYADIALEVAGYTAQNPRDFPLAFKVIDQFIEETHDGDEASQAEKLKAEIRQVELEFYEKTLNDAAVVYDKAKYKDKYSPATAIADMIRIITSVENPEFKNDAARRITQIRETDAAFLRGYKRTRPDTWAQMMEVPILLEFATQKGVIE